MSERNALGDGLPIGVESASWVARRGVGRMTGARGKSGAWGRIAGWGEGWAGRIAGDAARCVPLALALALGLMIDHEPGSGVFTLRWDPATLAFGLLGGLVATCVVGVFRWCMAEGRDAPGGGIGGPMMRVALIALSSSLARMVEHVPDSNVFTLRWDEGKFAFGLFVTVILVSVVGLWQWRSRVRSGARAPD